MSTFRELGVKEVERRFVGKKIKNKSEVVGKKISILDFEICPSKKNAEENYLKLQILLDGKKRFMSTGAKYLLQVMSQIEHDDIKNDPIEAVILQRNGYLYFKNTLEDEADEADKFDLMDRVKLKQYIREKNLSIKTKSSMTDDEIRILIRNYEDEEEE